MAYTWTLEQIETRFRELTGRSSTDDILQAEAWNVINDYYQNYFPEDALVTNFDAWFTQETSAVDSGEYDVAQTVVKFSDPMTINGEPIIHYQDKSYFFETFPSDEQYITSPTLAVGSSDSAKVKNSAFKYDISGWSYSKVSSETAFSGLDTIPQNKYGAFCLKIDSDGTITLYEADDNATGYNTPSLAIEGLPDADSDTAYLGYVVAISTDAGGFVPGTTALDDAAVTDTYTNGDPAKRGTPEGALYEHNTLFLRPKPDDIYLFQCDSEMNRPEALAAGEVPADIKWGPMIALGAAIIYLAPRGGQDRIAELTGVSGFSLSNYRLLSIKRKKRLAMRGRTAEPSF